MSYPTVERLGRSFYQLISAERLRERVLELGREITRDYAGRGVDLVLVGVLKGSILFLADLARAIELPLALELIGIASYGDQIRSTGVVQITSDMTRSIEGKHVILVEDIIDTGLTATYLLENFATRHPASMKLCSLLHKPERTLKQVNIDYLGFSVPDKFVVGYGLDMAQQFRNLDFIGYVES
jgi:hypoxanthine phosphoribosyltransferase